MEEVKGAEEVEGSVDWRGECHALEVGGGLVVLVGNVVCLLQL